MALHREEFLGELNEVVQDLDRDERVLRSLGELAEYEGLPPEVAIRLQRKASALGHTRDALVEIPAMVEAGQ